MHKTLPQGDEPKVRLTWQEGFVRRGNEQIGSGNLEGPLDNGLTLGIDELGLHGSPVIA